MATQIVEIDASDPPDRIDLRGDVRHVLVVVTRSGAPVALETIARPSNGILSAREFVAVLPAGESGDAKWNGAISGLPAPAPLTIVVPTHERPDDLARCLESLTAAREQGHELLVVDNGPRSERTASVAERFGVRRILESRLGLNRARNTGLATASHEIVAYVDDDVVVGRHWSTAVGSAFSDPHVVCVTGLVLPLELETDAQEQFELYCQHRRDLTARVFSRATLRSSAAGIVGMGANMAFRKEVLHRLGGFDVRLDAGTRTRSGGDTDMFARVLDDGGHVAYRPDALVWHRHRRSHGEVRSCVFGYGVGVFGMLTKRVVEQHDLGAFITAGRWLLGPIVKRARGGLTRRPAPRWDVVLAETAGAVLGPFCFAYETLTRFRREAALLR
jgi:GT2 family glycosyltransferase